MLNLEWARDAGAGRSSENVAVVKAMFGLEADVLREVAIIPPLELHLSPGQVVFITGASGGGKSSLLKLMEQSLVEHEGIRALRASDVTIPRDRAVVDTFDDEPIERVLDHLSRAGLAEALVMLRAGAELSDGERCRLELAHLLRRAERVAGAGVWPIVLADEFAATLDRSTALALAHRIRRWVSHTQHATFLAATTHDDLLEALDPDVLIEMRPLGRARVFGRTPGKKEESER